MKAKNTGSSNLSVSTWLTLIGGAWTAQTGLPLIGSGIRKYGPKVYENVLKPVGQFISNNWANPTTPSIAAFSIYKILQELGKGDKEQSGAKIILHGTLTFGSIGLMLTDWDFLGKFNALKNNVVKRFKKLEE